MKFKIIAAVGKNLELGKNNGLIWSLPGDLKFFKEATIGHTVLMGKNTFESLPKVLPNRKNIVITDTPIDNEEIEQYSSLDDFFAAYQDSKEDIFVIGGGMMYRQFIDKADDLYLTEVDDSDDSADTYFPEFNKNNYTKEIIKTGEDNGISYTHVLYKKSK